MLRRFIPILMLAALAACGDSGKKSDEHLAAGEALLRQGNYDAAMLELQRAVELNKDFDPRPGCARQCLPGAKTI